VLAVTRIEDTQVVMESLAKLSLIPKDVMKAWLTALVINTSREVHTISTFVRVSPPYEKTSMSKDLHL
jgi:hypothetical protein